MSWGNLQEPPVHVKARVRGSIDQAVAPTGTCIGWCKGQTEPNPLAACMKEKFENLAEIP